MFQRGLEDPTEFRVKDVPRHATLCNDLVVDPIKQVVDHHQFIGHNHPIAGLIVHLDVLDIVDDRGVH
ncbi:hypothetical protein D3C77_674140 [compost metagenome]